MAAEHIAGEEGAAAEEEEKVSMNRKEKRKAAKKQKRKQMRREAALKAREEEEARMNDPDELAMLRLMEEEEAQRAERERMEFEERERIWIEAMEVKMKKAAEEEEERKKVLKEAERAKGENENENEIESDEDGKWEYVEEGPAEIIWQGNEIIVKKKRVKVRKKDLEQESVKQDTKRPTSNPLPPQSEAFDDYKNPIVVSTQQAFDNVARQIPNFGTEQDKDHCPFHFKTGACRFGQRCSRVHFYPDRSCTLLIKNMYNGPGLAWEQDEGLEVCKWCHRAILFVGHTHYPGVLEFCCRVRLFPKYTDEEVERYYEEFYEDVHTEFLKFGEIVNFKVCRNGSIHLRGNVYVHYKSLDSAVLAYNSINARYFAGRQVSCEFVGVTRWKVAICGEFMKSRMKACSRGTACNFIHCFRNPGGDYEWADWDKPAPKYWVKKMVALFGFSDACDREFEEDRLGQLGNSSRTMAADTDRIHSRRSRSRDMDYCSFRDGNHLWKSLGRSRSDGRMQNGHEKTNHEHYEFDDNRDGHQNYIRRSSNLWNDVPVLADDEHCIHEFDFGIDELEKDGRRGKQNTSHSSRSRDISQETYSCRGDGDGDRDGGGGSSRKRLKRNGGKFDDLDDYQDKIKKTTGGNREVYSRRGHRDRNGGGSSRKRSIWYDEKLYDPDDESNSDWSDGDRYRGRVRKSASYKNKESEYNGGHCDKKNRGPDSAAADWSDRDRGGKQKHRRSRNTAPEIRTKR